MIKQMASGMAILFSSFMCLGAVAQAKEPEQCQDVHIGIVGWTDVQATTGVAEVILSSLGYKVDDTTGSQQIIFAGLERKQLNFFLGYWSPAMDDNIKPFEKRDALTVLEHPLLPDAKATLAVPAYAADKGLKTFADIARFSDQLDGKIYGIEAGSGANTRIQDMIDHNRFGLGGFTLVQSSEAGMLSAVTRAVSQKKPIVFLGWKPHPMNVRFDLAYLSGSEDTFGPGEGAATVTVVTQKNYAEQCPNVSRLLGNLVFNSDQVGQLMEPIMKSGEPKSVATAWLKKDPTVLAPWLKGVTTFDGKDGMAAVTQSLK